MKSNKPVVYRAILLFTIFCNLIMLSSFVSYADEMQQITLTTSAQTVSAKNEVKVVFCMEKDGLFTLKCDGKVDVSVYQANGTPITDLQDLYLTDDMNYSFTYPLDKGDYYIILSSNNYVKGYETTLFGKFEYKTPTLSKNKKTYSVIGRTAYYYKLTVKKAGYIVINTTSPTYYNNPIMYLCNKKKKELSAELSSVNESGKGKYSFAVEKGTYYVKVVPKEDYQYTIKYKFTKCCDKKGKAIKGGTSKKKAKRIKIGKSVSGVFLIKDKTSKKQWYKITSNTPREITLKLQGNVTSRLPHCLEYKVIGPYTSIDSQITKVGDSRTYNIWIGPEPTYICITKVGKKTSGNYKITVKK